MLNALSIDLEDWFHAELVRLHVDLERVERRVAWATEPILALLKRYDVRATFFVVGDVMRHHPDLVQRIHTEGHEIGCHGWSHRMLGTLEPERFAWELDEFDRDARGVIPLDEIVGFRAPTFSLDERTGWALDTLRAHGYRYDSSIFPARMGLYGVSGCPPVPYHPTAAEPTLDHDQPDFWEFPMTVYRAGGFTLPVAGGFYLRALPLALLRHALTQVNRQGAPFVVYVHPWEGDTATPRVRGLSPLHRTVTYHHLDATLRKLEALLQGFRFAPLRAVLRLEGGRASGGAAS